MKSLLTFEGIDSNHPLDRGGQTHYGLTLAAYQSYRPGSSWADLCTLSFDDVVDITTEIYALRPGFAKIQDPFVMWGVIDAAINSGPVEATKQLQRAVGVLPDGIFGRHTEEAVNNTNPERMFRRLIAHRIRHYGRIIRNDRLQAAFAAGWMERAAQLLESA